MRTINQEIDKKSGSALTKNTIPKDGASATQPISKNKIDAFDFNDSNLQENENQSEKAQINSKICSYCLEDKEHVFSGERLKDGTKIYVDGQRRRWAGRRCPDCEKVRVKQSAYLSAFEKSQIWHMLRKKGYTILSETYPYKVSKDNNIQSLTIKRAFADGQSIAWEEKPRNSTNLTLVLFQTIRMFQSNTQDMAKRN